MFLTRREKILWSLAAAVVCTIFLALFLGPALIGAISDSVMVVLFASGLILVAVTVLTQGLRVRPGGVEVGIVLGVMAIFVLLAVRLTLAERSHLLEFGVLAVLVYEALVERSSNVQQKGRKIRLPLVWAILICTSIGLIDEGLQKVLPDRVFDWEDVLFNTLAVTTAAMGMALLRRVRMKIDQRS